MPGIGIYSRVFALIWPSNGSAVNFQQRLFGSFKGGGVSENR